MKSLSGTIALFLTLSMLAACTPADQNRADSSALKTIVVTYGALGSLVSELLGDQARVVVLMPNGLDPHEWEPSAQDIALLNHADLVVRNGLGLEAGMQSAMSRAEQAGRPFFTAADHVVVRHVRPGEGLPGTDQDQAAGASDPHLWLSPLAMKAVVLSLAAELQSRFGLDLNASATTLAKRLDQLDRDIQAKVDALPAERRLLVTGHESLGYFAEHFGFTLVGAVVPGLSSQSQVSAADLADLKARMKGRSVAVIFSELGTPPRVAEALSRDLGIKLVPIATHLLPADGSWFSLMDQLASSIVAALK